MAPESGIRCSVGCLKGRIPVKKSWVVRIETWPGIFYILPGLVHMWSDDCKCSTTAIIIGNLRLAFHGVCNHAELEAKEYDAKD